MSQNGAYYLGGTQVILGVIGTSVFPTMVKPPSGSLGFQMKLLGAAGSTVQILPNQIPGLATGVSGIAVGTSCIGYPLTTADGYVIGGPAMFYLAATGATATVAFNWMFSAGGASLV